MDELIDQTVPETIKLKRELNLDAELTENELVKRLRQIADENNHNWRSFIGLGYYNCYTPAPILRNLFENPGKMNNHLISD